MFNLTITFSGICMLVRDPAHGMLHVLMPETGAHIHHARLIYVDQSGAVQKQNITGMHLELPGVQGTNGFSADVHPDVFDFGASLLGPRSVPRSLLGPVSPLPAPPLRTRVRLTQGKHGGVRPGGFWNFTLPNGTVVPRRLPTAVDWEIRGIDLPFLEVKDMTGGGSFEIHPDSSNNLHVLMVNVMPEELQVMGPDIPMNSKCPEPNEEAHHFALYAPILNPSTAYLLPRFDRPASHAAGLCATPVAGVGGSGHTHVDAAVSAAAAAAKAAAGLASGASADSAALAASVAAVAAASAALAAVSARPTHTPASAAGGGAGSELTCVVSTAPAE
jgi:hypothetical protein